MAAFANKYTMALNETVKMPSGKNKYKEVGKVDVPFPVLADFGIQAVQAVYTEDTVVEQGDKKIIYKKGEPMFEDNVPVYDDGKMDFLMSAVIALTLAKARNKFNKGKLKPGMEVATDFETLTAESERKGDALVMRREAKADFEAYLQSLDKDKGVVAKLGDMFFNSKSVLPTASERYLRAITQYSERWVSQLNEVKAARFAPKIIELQESINNASSEDDLGLEDEAKTEEKAA